MVAQGALRQDLLHEKGILGVHTARAKFEVAVLPPARELRALVQDYWIVTWDLREQAPHTQRVLPQASVNMTFKAGRSRVAGLSSGQFTEVLEGAGQVFGVRFRPGCFRALLGESVSAITDRFVGVETVFGRQSLLLEQQILSAGDEEAMAAVMDGFLRPILPPRDRVADKVFHMVEMMTGDADVFRVNDLARSFGVTSRRLQQLFTEHVGASPKWVIQRHRMQEAVHRAAAGDPVDWAQLAAELGYSDQAHFTRAFTATVGTPPASYARDNR